MVYYGSTTVKEHYPHEKIERALRYLAETDLLSLKPGDVIEIEGRDIYAMIQEYETLDPATIRLETHEKYYDVQYMVKGEEIIELFPRARLCAPEAYNTENDVTFYNDKIPHTGRVWLGDGDFAVISPSTAHKPRCMSGAKGIKVNKVVIKVRA